MSNSIQKYNFEDKILFFYFRYRGNISKIIEGLSRLPGYENTTIDPNYIAKIIRKFKRQRKDDWGINICYNFMEHLHMGVQERLCIYQEWLDKLKDTVEALVSTCHKVPVGERRVGTGAIEYVCLDPGCGKICSTVLLDRPEIYNLQIRILEEMRKDEEHLLKALKSLGFSVGETPNITKTTNYNLIVEDNKRVQSKGDKQLLTRIDDMDPRSRERLIKDLEKKIIDSEFENGDQKE